LDIKELEVFSLEDNGDDWYVDSTTNKHVAGNLGLFLDVKEIRSSKVRPTRRSSHPIKGKGVYSFFIP
jgi:hypothetical protein